jgi:small subunit ribosomal protein S17e
VRPERVKRISRELLKRFPDQFSADFEANKKALATVAKIYSTKLRNRIAGYVTRLVVISKAAETEETPEGGEEGGAEEEE